MTLPFHRFQPGVLSAQDASVLNALLAYAYRPVRGDSPVEVIDKPHQLTVQVLQGLAVSSGDGILARITAVGSPSGSLSAYYSWEAVDVSGADQLITARSGGPTGTLNLFEITGQALEEEDLVFVHPTTSADYWYCDRDETMDATTEASSTVNLLPLVLVRQSTLESDGVDTNPLVSFGDVVVQSGQPMWSVVTPTRLTCPAGYPGLYYVWAHVEWVWNLGSVSSLETTATIEVPSPGNHFTAAGTIAYGRQFNLISAMIPLIDGQYVELRVQHSNAATPEDVSVISYFGAARLGGESAIIGGGGSGDIDPADCCTGTHPTTWTLSPSGFTDGSSDCTQVNGAATLTQVDSCTWADANFRLNVNPTGVDRAYTLQIWDDDGEHVGVYVLSTAEDCCTGTKTLKLVTGSSAGCGAAPATIVLTPTGC